MANGIPEKRVPGGVIVGLVEEQKPVEADAPKTEAKPKTRSKKN